MPVVSDDGNDAGRGAAVGRLIGCCRCDWPNTCLDVQPGAASARPASPVDTMERESVSFRFILVDLQPADDVQS